MKHDKYEKPSWIATGIAIGIWMSLFVVLCVKCHAQDKDYDKIIKDFIQHEKEIERRDAKAQDKKDTIPVTILVRIQGRPWAFFHDGWEVRKVTKDDGNRSQPGSMLLWHDASAVGKPIYSHLLYLDSRKRPIRKEWVVYDKYSRQ